MCKRKLYPYTKVILFTWLPLCGAFTLSNTGCRSSPDIAPALVADSSRDPGPSSNLALTAGGRKIDGIAAIVNQDPILQSEVNEKTEEIYKIQPGLPPRESDAGKRKFKELLTQVLDRLINEKLVTQQQKNPIYQTQLKPCTEEVIQTAMDNIKKQNNIASNEEFFKALESQGIDYADYRRTLCGKIVESQVVNMAVGSRIHITDTELKNYYDQVIQKSSAGSAEVHLYDLLIPVDIDASTEEVVKAKTIAEEIIKKLKQGQTFETAAKAYEIDGIRSDRADLGFISVKDLPDELKEDVLIASKDELRGPLRAGRGFHIFKWVDKRNADVRSFEEAKEGLRNQLYEKRRENAIESWLKELRRKEYIEIRLSPS